MSIFLTVCHIFHSFYLSKTDFQNFPGPVACFQEFPVLENATTKFQDFSGFPGPVRTLLVEGVFKTFDDEDRRPVILVGRAPDCCAGGRGLKPRPDQQSGS